MAGTGVRHYFVDESGDGVLFDGRGRIVATRSNLAQNFILGLLDVARPEALANALTALREELLKDPYLNRAPSLRPERLKTARTFHAKDDLPEVRRDVFKLLMQHEVRFSAVVKSMKATLDYVRSRGEVEPGYRYHPDELYDHVARRLFRQRLHKEGEYRIVFSRRGATKRTRALAENLERARDEFLEKHGIENRATISVGTAFSYEEPCLQAADYFLWALQRLYEKGEDRYLEFVWPKISLIHDVDDTREKAYGRYYESRRPLTRGEIEGRLRI